MNLSGLASRRVKRNWRLSLIGLFVLFAVSIALGFHYLENIALPLTLIGIMPPSLYYFYSEVIKRPHVEISNKDFPISVAPMYAGIEGGPSDFTRPALFYRISVENQGKATAERARIQIRLSGDTLDREYYGRWSGPANADEYDLLPGQNKTVMVIKMFLTTDFYERLDGLKEIIQKENDIDLDSKQISPLGNPPGEIRDLDDLESYSFRPIGFTPREQRPERSDRSIHGGWEGQEIMITGENITDGFTLSTRVVADNYKTEWEREIDSFSFMSVIQEATENEQCWQRQWENQGLSELRDRLRIKMKDWLENHSGLTE